jgi:hypothetical protein
VSGEGAAFFAGLGGVVLFFLWKIWGALSNIARLLERLIDAVAESRESN